MKIYGVSGLGADKIVYQYLSLKSPLVCIDWIDPLKNESIEAYALRFSKKIKKGEDFGIIGVSFGGLIAVEISKIMNPVFTILISSVQAKSELRSVYRFVGKLNLIKFIPTAMFRPPKRMTNFFFGARDKKRLFEILDDADPIFTKWAVHVLVSWKNKQLLNNCTKICGGNDRLMPVNFTDNTLLIQKGTHFMIVDQAAQISIMINEIIKKNEVKNK